MMYAIIKAHYTECLCLIDFVLKKYAKKYAENRIEFKKNGVMQRITPLFFSIYKLISKFNIAFLCKIYYALTSFNLTFSPLSS